MFRLSLSLTMSSKGGGLPANVLTLNGQPITLNGQFITLKKAP